MDTNYSSGLSDDGSNMGSKVGAGTYDDTAETSRQSGYSLREELANLKRDLDALMAHASTLTDRELSEARDKMMAKFSSMQNTAKGMAAEASRQFTQGVDATSDYVKEKPLQSVAVAAGIGLLLGAVLRRH
jgi:ElaB/YqjD/DUF883 family membrane-anchored ribosome-binding protein